MEKFIQTLLKNLDSKLIVWFGFEIYLENIKDTKEKLRDRKAPYQYSDFQKSERDFAFIVDKNIKAQDLINIILSVDKKLIKSANVFDVYEGENISSGKKSIAINVNYSHLIKH